MILGGRASSGKPRSQGRPEFPLLHCFSWLPALLSSIPSNAWKSSQPAEQEPAWQVPSAQQVWENEDGVRGEPLPTTQHQPQLKVLLRLLSAPVAKAAPLSEAQGPSRLIQLDSLQSSRPVPPREALNRAFVCAASFLSVFCPVLQTQQS